MPALAICYPERNTAQLKPVEFEGFKLGCIDCKTQRSCSMDAEGETCDSLCRMLFFLYGNHRDADCSWPEHTDYHVFDDYTPMIKPGRKSGFFMRSDKLSVPAA